MARYPYPAIRAAPRAEMPAFASLTATAFIAPRWPAAGRRRAPVPERPSHTVITVSLSPYLLGTPPLCNGDVRAVETL
jgi:hypothetical protein